ncbi:MAG: acyl-CoA dehydrogenase [Armatimonadetes bacterium]|nr:acyl-CoA dehydrogenase [Armatimonadota bacterium]
MVFRLNEQQEMIQDTARKFAQREIEPQAARLDEEGKFCWEIHNKLSELGFMGMLVPEAYGGMGADAVSYVIAVEELTAADLSQNMTMTLHNSLVAFPLMAFGTEEQKRKYLPGLASGKSLGAFALTEPGAGSDAANQETTARKDGDSWVLKGNKIFITNGSIADFLLVFAATDREAGKRGISCFIVEKETPGFSVTGTEKKMGINASPTASLAFEDCRVPETALLGNPGQGYEIALKTLDGGRIGIAAQAVGIAQGALSASVRYARERKQFGRPIGEFGAIQNMLADMATRIDAARLLVYKAAWMKDEGLPYTRESAECKLYASETCTWVTQCAVQIFGGYGYMKEYPVERRYRESKVTEIYEGTSEIQRLVIAHSLLKNGTGKE